MAAILMIAYIAAAYWATNKDATEKVVVKSYI